LSQVLRITSEREISIRHLAYADKVPLQWNLGSLADGLRCYRNAEFFEAHEHWELVWLGLDEPEKSFLQAVIQVTAAFHHLQTGNTVGAASLLRRALHRLEGCPAHFGGIAAASLCHEVRQALQNIEGMPAQTNPITAPHILTVD
jgi:predicted metal-dependent hydrolase